MTSSDPRPLAALGHAYMSARDVEPAARRLEAVGVRPIVIREGLAVMELRGGTHIVIRETKDEAQQEAPFDLMYDDIDQAHGLLARSGFEVTEIEQHGIPAGVKLTPMMRQYVAAKQRYPEAPAHASQSTLTGATAAAAAACGACSVKPLHV